MTSKERINQRFAKDFNLPINIFGDYIFEYYHRLYAFWPESEWNALLKEINDDYGGNMDAWLEHYASVRDDIIRTLEASESYQEFNQSDLSKYAVKTNIPDRNIYNQECVGKYMVSMDLKKANFQALKYVGVIDDDSYEDLIDKFDKSFYFKKSKYSRQVIFGKLNPKRTITVERYMMNKIITDMVFPEMESNHAKLIAFKSDEIIWEIDKPLDSTVLSRYEREIKDKLNFHVRAECFIIKKLPIVNVHGNDIGAYIRRNVNTGEDTLKCVSTIYFPQVYKLVKGLELNDIDLMFYFEDQSAHFDNPLILKEDEDISDK